MKRLALTLAFVLIAAACTAVMPIQPVAVKGTAMLPALKEGDRIIIERNPQSLARVLHLINGQRRPRFKPHVVPTQIIRAHFEIRDHTPNRTLLD